MAELTGFLTMWLVVAAAANRAGEVVDHVPAYRTPSGVGCGMGLACPNRSK